MNAHARLRTYALNDLRRLTPHAHYWGREHSPQADHELTDPLLCEPVRFELTPREHDAARALADLATYELRSRAISSRAFPVQDFDPSVLMQASPGMSDDEEIEITARLELLRRSALVYARVVNDDQLIEAFQFRAAAATESDTVKKPTEGEASPSAAPASETVEERQRRRLDRLKALGGDRVPKPGGLWKWSGRRGAMAALAREEADAGQPYSDVRDVARDLDAEADRRRASRAMPLS